MRIQFVNKFLAVAGLLFVSMFAHAQTVVTTTPSATPSPAAMPMPTPPPEQRAYDEARRIKDPVKKLEALEKVTKDFPNSFVVTQARYEMLDTTIKNFPKETERIRAVADKILEPSKSIPLTFGSTKMLIASRLMDAGVLLDWAEELTTTGSTLYEQELAKNLRRQKARNEDTLGRIYLKEGKTKLAQRTLKQALIDDPELSTSMIGLGQLAENSGDHKAAVE